MEEDTDKQVARRSQRGEQTPRWVVSGVINLGGVSLANIPNCVLYTLLYFFCLEQTKEVKKGFFSFLQEFTDRLEAHFAVGKHWQREFAVTDAEAGLPMF